MNAAPEPSVAAPSDATDTVTVPSSVIFVSAVVFSAVRATVADPFAVLAPVSVTSSVSSRSRIASVRVAIVIVPMASSAASVSVPNGAV